MDPRNSTLATFAAGDGEQRIGILTSGGDCPGLNAVVRGAYLTANRVYGRELVGIRDGWRGLVEKSATVITRDMIAGIEGRGGTVLGTSRTNPLEGQDPVGHIREVLHDLAIDSLIVVGGEGTLAVAQILVKDGLKIVGVPKTIDNDLRGTDYTFGFDTAVQIATDAMDRLRTTGSSHGRCMVAEVMGRHAGWIALHSGLAAGAQAILIPEQKTGLDEVSAWVRAAHARGLSPLVVVAEGFTPSGEGMPHSERGLDAFGRPRLGGIGEIVANAIEAATGIETRATTLGHIQRGGTPTSYDRILATRFGMAAVDATVAQKWGQMVSLRGREIECVALNEALEDLNTVPDERYEAVARLFG